MVVLFGIVILQGISAISRKRFAFSLYFYKNSLSLQVETLKMLAYE